MFGGIEEQWCREHGAVAATFVLDNASTILGVICKDTEVWESFAPVVRFCVAAVGSHIQNSKHEIHARDTGDAVLASNEAAGLDVIAERMKQFVSACDGKQVTGSCENVIC